MGPESNSKTFSPLHDFVYSSVKVNSLRHCGSGGRELFLNLIPLIVLLTVWGFGSLTAAASLHPTSAFEMSA